MEYFLGIDLGGTAIKTAVLDNTYRIIASCTRETRLPRPWNEILDDCAQSVFDVCAQVPDMSLKKCAFAGIGTPGIVDIEKGVVEVAANLGFYGVPIKDYLEKNCISPCIRKTMPTPQHGESILPVQVLAQNLKNRAPTWYRLPSVRA